MATRYIAASLPVEMKPQTRLSCGKYFERRIIRAWKTFSRATRKQPRASFLPEDFVLMTARRRSIRYN